jgi:Ser/Thr protein kinase RdoA (MazF antagonist)
MMASQPMEEIIKFVQGAYRLPAVNNIASGPKPGSYVLTSAEGSYLFAPVATYKLRHLSFDEAFTSFLVHSNYPAQSVVRTAAGELTSELSGEPHVLRTFFPGCVPDVDGAISTIQLENAAKALAALHITAQSYSGSVRHRHQYRSEYVLRSLAEAIDRLEGHEAATPFDELVLRVARRKRVRVGERPFETQAFLEEGRIMNHGDFHPRNIVFDQASKVVGLLDFEYCTFMPRIWDVAWALHWFSRQRKTEAFCGVLDLARATAFLSAYHAVFPLGAQDRENLAQLMQIANAHASYGVVGYSKYGASFFATRRLEPCTSEGEWFWCVDNIENLATAIEEACP